MTCLRRRSTERGLDFAALGRGESAALSAFVDEHAGWVWQLARRGFVVHEDDQRLFASGTHRAEALEKLTVSILAEVLTPARRTALTEPELARRVVLEVARRRLLQAAAIEGRELSLGDEPAEDLPTDVLDLDVEGANFRWAPPSEPPRDLDREARDLFLHDKAALEDAVRMLDPKDAALFERRLRSAAPRKLVASELGLSPTAVKEGERRLVRHLLHALRRTHLHPGRIEVAELEALVQGDENRASLPARTAERIREDVLRRTFTDEPRPYAARATLAFGSLGAALGLYALMFFGVIPGPDDDVEVPVVVSVSCAPHCTSASKMDIELRAPNRARRVALWLRNGRGEAAPLFPETGGRSTTLPIGARVRAVTIARDAPFPKDPGPGPFEVVAVFSNDRPSLASLKAHVEGSRRLSEVVTHASPVGP